VSFETKSFLLVIASAFALAAILLYIQDYFYTARTGKPAAERVREKIEKSNRPWSKGQYLFLLISNSILIVSALVVLLTASKSWSRVTPVCLILFGAVRLFNLHLRKQKEQRSVTSSEN
jgi:hypothetical protein